MTPDWHTADKAYLTHHTACPQCIAAGGSPGRKHRCSTGQALWDTYNQAGTPTHMLPREKQQQEATP